MNMRDKGKLPIGAAAQFLDRSIDTLRLWDKSGKLKAHRSAGGHRYYYRQDLERFRQDLFAAARTWAESVTAPDLPSEQYCETQDRFRSRLGKMAALLDQDKRAHALVPLLVAVAGEIGNNSFDHNIGNWPDVLGIFFAYDADKRIIVLADRGLGIRTTLSRVRPDLKDDIAAMRVAMTERVSGRAPEQRGNGLKFVSDVATKHSVGVVLQSGTAKAEIQKEHGSLFVDLADRNVPGAIAKITY